jgi:hypothetical protein
MWHIALNKKMARFLKTKGMISKYAPSIKGKDELP